MIYPNFSEEKKLWKKGYKMVAGLDEAGRGPLAGPVVAAAVVINFKFEILNLKSIFNDPILKKIKDSKMMMPKTREEAYKTLINHPQIKWGIGIVSEKIIDEKKIHVSRMSKKAREAAKTAAVAAAKAPLASS